MYLVIDVETTRKNKGEDAVGEFDANPYHPDNEIVLFGYKTDDRNDVDIETLEQFNRIHLKEEFEEQQNLKLLVGHNIKFDLAYICKHQPEFLEVLPNIVLWDTMLAEYILSGQETLFPSLDDTAPKYGGTTKDDRAKHLMDAGVCPSEWPEYLLRDYLKNDVLNTEKIFLGQLKRAQDSGMIALLTTQMLALAATFTMEFRGSKFDKHKAAEIQKELESERNHLHVSIHNIFKSYMPFEEEININSAQQLSLVLFGGKYNVIAKEPAGIYKSGIKKGKPKFRNVEKEHYSLGMGVLKNPDWETKTKGIYQTNDEVLEIIYKTSVTGVIKGFVTGMKRYRELQKEIETYYVGYSSMVHHDGYIHPTYNHCATKTGRLSCSNPNLQNATRSE